jgi:serine/threonine protein kinase/Tfp pilus assembly protein PilF
LDRATLSHYTIIKKLGAGGMGEVYLAQDTKLERKIALKVLLSEFVSNEDRLRRFIQEAKAAASLSHPNIAHVYEVGDADGVHYIAMEFIDGDTLTTRIHRDVNSLSTLLRYLSQVAEGLAKAHSAGIVHRDLKPDNIMITGDGYAKILDFGLAKLIETQASSVTSDEAATAVLPAQPMSAAGAVMGTVGYMSPEQAKGKPVDQRSDIFSFGCILYEAATGRRPFEGDSAIDTLHKIIYSSAAPITDFNPAAPPDLQRVVRRCLAKEPEKRYQTMIDVANDLEDLRREINVDPETSRSIPPKHTSADGARPSQTGPDLRDTRTPDVQTAPTSSAEYLVSRIGAHKGAVAVVLTLLALAAFGIWLAVNRSSSSSDAVSSLAVLPFVNASGNADVEYLSDGMTETLISSLSQLPKLSVKARSSVFRYKGKETNPRDIGKELDVQAILVGRVAQRGDQLILSLELIDVRSENVLWAEQYNRKQTDLVTLQTEIARDVSSKLRTKLSGADEQRLAKTYTANPEAYQHYLRGRFYWNKRNAENIRKAIEQFKAAAEKDPGFALAYAGLADCYVLTPYYIGTWASETLPSAKAYATRAIEIDPSLAEAYASLGHIQSFSWNFAEAEIAFKRSIELNPSYATAHHWYSRYLRAVGRPDEAFAEIKRAQELDPLSLVIMSNIAENHLEHGDMNPAQEECKRQLELDPNFFSAYQTLCIIYSIQGRLPEALAAAQKSVELSNRLNGSLALLGFVQGKSGRRDAAQAVIVELEKRYSLKQADGRDLAVVYMGLDQRDKVFEWLEKSYQNRSYFMATLRLEHLFEPLHSDPRWKELLRRGGLPQ